MSESIRVGSSWTHCGGAIHISMPHNVEIITEQPTDGQKQRQNLSPIATLLRSSKNRYKQFLKWRDGSLAQPFRKVKM